MGGWLNREVQKILPKLEKSPIKVKILSYTPQVYDLAAASARTCYSSRGILSPEDMEANRELAEKVARQTLRSGHLTTRQHAHFVFGLEGVSRRLIWQFLHSHPYYNSEQVSQRYVPIKANRSWYSLPDELDFAEIHEYHQKLHQAYERLIILLEPTVAELYFSIHKLKAKTKEKYLPEVKKKAMEVARYVLPISTTAYLYHTISLLTLIRYAYLQDYHNDIEEKILVIKMLQKVCELDPRLEREFPEPLSPREMNIPEPQEVAKNHEKFDLFLENKRAKLISATEKPIEKLKSIFTISQNENLSDSELLEKILSSKKNSLIADVFYPVSLDETSRILNHIHFTFAKKLSHSADSQEQRHRTLPGSRPRLETQISFKQDYVTPTLFNYTPKALSFYQETMEYIFSFLQKQKLKGISPQGLTYLLPNAFPIRFYESGDFLGFYHKWKSRLCYNAQEEIFYSALDEVRQVQEYIPELKSYLGAPCFLRENLKPRCPEGEHFCGVKVWQLPLEAYQRII